MKRTLILILSICTLLSPIYSQKKDKKAKDAKGYLFTTQVSIPTTPIKNQAKSGTCWSFAGVALVEAEILRNTGNTFDLSEMFIVRNAYYEKTIKNTRYHGSINYGGGGAFHDVINMMKKHGIVPEEVYNGLNYGEVEHNHSELDAVMSSFAKTIASAKQPTTAWSNACNGILDAYLGKYPTQFTFNGSTYDPESFLQSLGVNLDDFVSVSSFNHHPFYSQFVIEVPDNWMFEKVYNLPLSEMMTVIDKALENGYTVGWAADVSERGFSWRNGVAIVPDEDKKDLTGSEQEKWEKLTASEKQAQLYSFEQPIKEKKITQEYRQQQFDNFQTTDDHGMLIYGIAHDQNGNKYYMVKNSWGTNQKYEGIFYASQSFVEAKTLSIMLNKNAIPKEISQKLFVD